MASKQCFEVDRRCGGPLVAGKNDIVRMNKMYRVREAFLYDYNISVRAVQKSNNATA